MVCKDNSGCSTTCGFNVCVAGMILRKNSKLMHLLLRSRERLRSIVMSMSVCVSVCLSVRKDTSGTTCAIFTKFLMYVVCVRGSVILIQVYDRPHRLSPGRGFLPH